MFMTYFLNPLKLVPEGDRVFYELLWLGKEAMNIRDSWKIRPEEFKKLDFNIDHLKTFWNLALEPQFNTSCCYLLNAEQKLNQSVDQYVVVIQR